MKTSGDKGIIKWDVFVDEDGKRLRVSLLPPSWDIRGTDPPTNPGEALE